MLLPSKLRQLTDSCHQLLLGIHEAIVESFTLSGKKLILRSFCQNRIQLLIKTFIPIVARTVSGIVADIERLIAFGSLGQLRVMLIKIRIVISI